MGAVLLFKLNVEAPLTISLPLPYSFSHTVSGIIHHLREAKCDPEKDENCEPLDTGECADGS